MAQKTVVILSQKQDEYDSETRISGIRNVSSDCPEGTNTGTQYEQATGSTRLLLRVAHSEMMMMMMKSAGKTQRPESLF